MNTLTIKCTFFLLAAIAFLSPVKNVTAQRTRASFNNNWKFKLDSLNDYSKPSANTRGWRTLNVPHDWSIEFPFDSASPTGNGGGALRGGLGWYVKNFTVPLASKNKIVSIDFDGVYMNSEVWINGHWLGLRPYGFSSFRYDLTPWLKYGTENNVIAVKVDNSKQPNSRWYSGSGIYRNVWLVTTDKIYIDHWGTFITTPVVNKNSATVHIAANIRHADDPQKNVIVTNIIYNAAGREVARKTSNSISLKDTVSGVAHDLTVTAPSLWSDTNPYLYKVVTQVMSDGKLIDAYTTPMGIRSFVFDVNKGFLLNGKPVKINGVCDHHDLGCLGAAINTRALERQLEILKGMGCNGIRTSHNPPAPELLDLCDKMGFIVMDEAFDMWKKQKNKYDYHLVWDEWHQRDLEDLILRDRNHPSVFMWSIGNEILEQWDSSGITIAKELAGIVKALDTTRPITSALNDPQPGNKIYQSGALDLVGFNYHHQNFADFQKNFPGQKFIGTETVSALETRGHYDLIPSDSLRRWPERWDKPFNEGNKDLTVSAYDNVSAPWGSTHEETWKEMKKYNFLSGQYIWTGFDYIGEPTPYPWPARSSYFGIIDLAGFPKDVYYMYQSEWTNKNVLHLLPHWNWKQGDTVDVWAYYNNADEVELYLNGKSVGIKKKTGDDLHVMWRLPFEPGTLKAISRKNGGTVLTKEVTTAGPAYKIELTADRKIIASGGDDVSFVTVKVLDKNGNLVPDAANLVQFEVTNGGSIAGVDNGNETSMESFKDNKRKAFNGLCLAVIKAGSKKGNIVLKATAPGLQTAQVNIISK
ncbi:beta-galactosidase GalB [Ferruginibacter paludis]|uniref:beta-galactosidase GalB n=1 Tax=Ferruginibacter paludis TaxID=1310417 RepID=UPI0025B32F27|nr:beta-galactosidase GalB [Ferruginibacter paludis]MDN3654638.1 beta-galactosidase GalB [Ferruginibacter paludis]